MKAMTMIIAATLLAFAAGATADDSVERAQPLPATQASEASSGKANCRHYSVRPAGNVTEVTIPHCRHQSAARRSHIAADAPAPSSHLPQPAGAPPNRHPR